MTIKDSSNKTHFAHAGIGVGIITLCGTVINSKNESKFTELKTGSDQKWVDCNVCKAVSKEAASVIGDN